MTVIDPLSVLATTTRESSSLMAIRLELLGFLAMNPDPVTGRDAGVGAAGAAAVLSAGGGALVGA